MDDRQADRRSRRLLTVALLLLTGATGAAFGRVFQPGTTARLVLAGALATLLAVALERRNLPLSLLVSAAGLLFIVGWLVFPGATASGFLPTTTVDRLVRALGQLGAQVSDRDVPAPAIPPLYAPAILAMWWSAYASHALAARAGSSLLALVPPAAILAFAAVVAEDGARPGYAAAFLAAGLAVLFAARMRRLGSWATTPGGSAGSPTRSARRLGLAAMSVALLLPGLLPGFRSGPLVDVDGDGDDGIVITPLVDIRPNLLRDDHIELFRVRSTHAAYWRLLSLDRFTGRFWMSSDPDSSGGIVVEDEAPLGGGISAGGTLIQQQYRISELAGAWLPAAYEPRAIETDGRTIRHDPDAGSILDPEGLSEDYGYRVTSEIRAPSPEELASGPQEPLFDPLQMRLYGVSSAYTALPADTPPQIHRFARGLTSGVDDPYGQALAIQNYLRQFVYDELAPPGHGIHDVLHFLRTRRGYCEQFAGTMAVLLRSLGYPARVVVGFLPGDLHDDGWYHVTTDDAHSWVEMFFPGYGWLAFEPTPTRANPTAAPYLLTTIASGGSFEGNRRLALPPAELDRRGRGRLFSSDQNRSPGSGQATLPRIPLEEPAADRPWTGIPALLFLVALAGAALVLIPTAKIIARRIALTRAGSPAEKVLVSYRVFEAGAADLGLGRRHGETLEEYGRRLSAEVPVTGETLNRMTALAGRAAYSGERLGSDSASEARAATRALSRDVRRHAGPVSAIRAAVRPTRPL